MILKFRKLAYNSPAIGGTGNPGSRGFCPTLHAPFASAASPATPSGLQRNKNKKLNIHNILMFYAFVQSNGILYLPD